MRRRARGRHGRRARRVGRVHRRATASRPPSPRPTRRGRAEAEKDRAALLDEQGDDANAERAARRAHPQARRRRTRSSAGPLPPPTSLGPDGQGACPHPQAEDFPRWYQDVVAKAELADNGPVRGTMVIRPYGYAIWERMQAEVDARIKAAGAANAYFPLFIPESYLQREAEHVEGFAPSSPSSPTPAARSSRSRSSCGPRARPIISELLRQVGAELPRPAAAAEPVGQRRALGAAAPRVPAHDRVPLAGGPHRARDRGRRRAPTPRGSSTRSTPTSWSTCSPSRCCVGRKTARERFPGAINTLTCEAMMRDGKALQMGTSHELGQNFAAGLRHRSTSTESGTQQFVWQTSWGASTRMVGGLIMGHGDDAGLRLPPRSPPSRSSCCSCGTRTAPARRPRRLAAELAAPACASSSTTAPTLSFGRRVTDWELKGVPRAARGRAPRPGRGRRHPRPPRHRHRRRRSTWTPPRSRSSAPSRRCRPSCWRRPPRDATSARPTADTRRGRRGRADGFARMPWAVIGDEGEARLADAAVTVRCLQRADGSVPLSDDEPDLVAYCARSY